MSVSWKRTVFLTVLILVMSFAISGLTLASISGISILSPTNEAPGYYQPGDTVTVTALIEAEVGDTVFLRGWAGATATGAFLVSGVVTDPSGEITLSCEIPLDASEPDGWKNISVEAYASSDGSPKVATEVDAIVVDTQPPDIKEDTWRLADGTTVSNGDSFDDVTEISFLLDFEDPDPSSGKKELSMQMMSMIGSIKEITFFDSDTILIEIDQLTPGNVSFGVQVRDNCSNTSAEEVFAFVVADASGPIIDDTSWSLLDGTPVPDGTVFDDILSLALTVEVSDDEPSSGIDASSLSASVTNGSIDSATFDSTTGKITVEISDLKYGAHTLTVDIADIEGNSAVQRSLTFTVDDTKAPEYLSWNITDGQVFNDVTSIDIIGRQFDAAPSSGIAGEDFSVTDGVCGTLERTWIVKNTECEIKIPITNLTFGEHSFNANVFDNAGNTSETTILSFIIGDTKAPIIDDASWRLEDGTPLSDGDGFDDVTELTILVDASDSAPSSGIDPDSVNATLSGGTVDSVQYDPETGTITVIISGLGCGNETLTVGISDNEGNAAVPRSITFEVKDTVAPVIDDTTWSVEDDTWIGQDSIDISIDVADAVPSSGIDASSLVAWIVPATGSVTPSYSGDATEGTIEIAATAMSRGANEISVEISDSAGNKSAKVSLTLNVDLDAPVIDDSTWEWSGHGALVDNGWAFVDEEDITIIVNVNDNSGPSSGLDPDTLTAKLVAPNGDEVDQEATFDTDLGEIIVAVKGLRFSPFDRYRLIVSISDNVGNSSQEDLRFLVRDNEAPYIDEENIYYEDWTSYSDEIFHPIYDSEWGVFFVRHPEIVLHLPIVDDEPSSGIAGFTDNVVLTYDYGVGNLEDYDYIYETGEIVVYLSGLTDGWHRLLVSISDWAGNRLKRHSMNIVVNTIPPPVPGAPATDSPTSSDTQRWEWLGVECDDFAFYELRLDADDENIITGITDTYVETNLAEGEHFAQVRSVDVARNRSAWSDKGYVTVDQSSPGKVEGLMITTPPNNRYPAFVWNSVSDDLSSILEYEIEYGYGESWNSVKSTTAKWNSPVAFDDGDYVIRVRAIDTGGNAGEWSDDLAFVIDTTAPVITFINPLEGEEYNINTLSTVIVKIEGDFDSETVRMRYNDEVRWVEPTTIDGDTAIFILSIPLSPDSDQSIRVRVSDSTGNSAEAEVSYTFDFYRQGFGFGRFRFEDAEVNN